MGLQSKTSTVDGPATGHFGKIGEKYGGNILEIWSFSGIRYLRSDETSSREGTAWENMLTKCRSRDWGVSRDLLDSNLDRRAMKSMSFAHEDKPRIGIL